MKTLNLTAALLLMPLTAAMANAPRVVDTTPTSNERIFAVLTMLSENAEDIDSLGLSVQGALALQEYVGMLKTELIANLEAKASELCRNKETLKYDPNALADLIDADGESFKGFANSKADGFAGLLDEADRAAFNKWMLENTDTAVLHLTGNPVREGKVSAELVLKRACGGK